VDHHFTDRSIVFPLFSGLFLLLKSGALPQDEECTYEQNLVAQYVTETKLNGNPVHYARSLAMHAETMAKLGKFESALSVHSQLRTVYVPELHSEGICNSYGSDRAAQSIGLSAVWLMEVGKEEEALETCDLVINELLPKMDIRNVHNSYMLMFPILLIMQSHGKSLVAYKLFKEYVVDAFDQHFGEGGSTPSRFLHKPMLMFLDLDGNQERDVMDFASYLHWALRENNIRFGARNNIPGLSFGRLHDCISASICLLLAKRVECERGTKKHLVVSALAVCRDAVALATKVKSGPCTRNAMALLDEIEEYQKELLDGGS
jgi:hypothetical protein